MEIFQVNLPFALQLLLMVRGLTSAESFFLDEGVCMRFGGYRCLVASKYTLLRSH